MTCGRSTVAYTWRCYVIILNFFPTDNNKENLKNSDLSLFYNNPEVILLGDADEEKIFGFLEEEESVSDVSEEEDEVSETDEVEGDDADCTETSRTNNS